MKKTYYRGDVYMADLGQGVGSEHGDRGSYDQQGGLQSEAAHPFHVGGLHPGVIFGVVRAGPHLGQAAPGRICRPADPKGDPAAGLRPGCEFWPAKAAEEKKREGPQIFFDHDLMPLLC